MVPPCDSLHSLARFPLTKTSFRVSMCLPLEKAQIETFVKSLKNGRSKPLPYKKYAKMRHRVSHFLFYFWFCDSFSLIFFRFFILILYITKRAIGYEIPIAREVEISHAQLNSIIPNAIGTIIPDATITIV